MTARVRQFRRWAGISGTLLLLAWFAPCLSGATLGGNFDLRTHILPLQFIISTAWRDGELPQWNPYIFCGAPLNRSAAFTAWYPPHLCYALVTPAAVPVTATALLAAHAAAAVAAAFWYFYGCLRLGRAAFFAATAYLLSLPLAISLATGTNNFLPFVILPLLLGIVRRWGQRGYTQPAIGIATALFWALWLGSHPPMAAYVTVAVVLTTAIQRHPLVSLRRLLLALVCAIGLGAFHILPFIAGMVDAGGQTGDTTGWWAQYQTAPPELLRLFLPDLFGRSEDAYGGSETPAESFPVYAGLFPALLALYGLLFLRGRHLLPAQLGLLLIPLVVCNTPAIWLHRLLLGNIPLQYSRLAFLLPLPLALLAAHTAAHLARQPRRWLAFLLFAFAVAFLLAAAAGSLPLADGSMRPLGRTVALRHALTVLLAGVPCLLLLAGGSRQRRGLAFALLVIITVGDCWTAVAPHAHPGWPFLIPPERVWPAPSGIPAAAGAVPHTGRVLPERPELFGAQVAVHGLFSSTGYDNFVPPRIGALYAWPHGYSRAAGRSLTPRSLRAQQLAATAWHLLPDGMAPVPGSLPRLAGFRDVLVVPDDRQALSLLMADTFPYQRLVVLAEPPAHPLTATRWSTRLTAESSNRVTCQSESNGFFLLLLNDTLAPGWEVLIDESDALLLRANTAFRACTVPPGRHIITFVYHAPGLRAGSLITVATCLGLLFWLCRNRR